MLAVDSFRASKVRFMLTALGMVIGSASLILVVTVGLTGKEYALNLLRGIGSNMVVVDYQGGGNAEAGIGKEFRSDYLTREDEAAVVQQVPAVAYSSPMVEMHDRISFGGGVVKDILVLGITPEYRQVRNLIVLVRKIFRRRRRAISYQGCGRHRAFRPATLRKCGRGNQSELRDQRYSLHHHRHLQREGEYIRTIRGRGSNDSDSLFRGALLHWNEQRKTALLFHSRSERRAGSDA